MESLGSCDEPLVEQHDLVMLDLDGVVYISGKAIAGVSETIERVRATGTPVAFVTNNASRTAGAVAERLEKIGVAARPEDVVTSAQAAASLLRERYGEGARILALGGAGLDGALRDRGLTPVTDYDEPDAVALVTGYGPDVLWRHIMRCAVLVRRGLPWVASNDDASIPTAYGPAPGHGMLVKTIADFAGVWPDVAGKPSRPLLDETIERVGGTRPLMVGDRLDTDIEGARRVGVDSLLVLTGVTGLPELVAARPQERPTYISPTLDGLCDAQSRPQADAEGFALGGWSGRISGSGALELQGSGRPEDWWRVAAVTAWAHLDETGSAVQVDGLVPPLDGVDDVGLPGAVTSAS